MDEDDDHDDDHDDDDEVKTLLIFEVGRGERYFLFSFPKISLPVFAFYFAFKSHKGHFSCSPFAALDGPWQSL